MEKKKVKDEAMNLFSFLKKTKIHLLIKRNIHNEKLYSCEILNGWIKRNSFFLNVYGIGDSEIEAVNDMIRQISRKVIVLNIDNLEKKTVIKVPYIHCLKQEGK